EVLCRLMALVDARAAVVADELRVESLTLWPLLEPSLETYYDFVHFTPAGSAVVAEAVGAALLRSPPAVAARPLGVQAPARWWRPAAPPPCSRSPPPAQAPRH